MSMPTRRFVRSAALLLSFLIAVAAGAESDPLGSIAEEDRSALEALSLYPEDLRLSILEASTEAHVLTELGARQKKSRDNFGRLLEPYEQDTQEQLFQLTRYPALVAEIVAGGPKSADDLETIAARYPEDARDAARSAGEQHWKLVSRVHALLAGEQAAFEQLVGDLPDTKQSAFLVLIDTPEVLALMSENTEMIILLGDAYEREPEAVRTAFDALQREVAERNAAEARDFAEVVDADPELKEEVEASYREYQNETEEYVEAPAPVQQVIVEVRVVRAYSYWTGVPPWVRADYSYYDPWIHWYPRHHWRHSGYHFGPRFALVHGAPHHGFYGWFFNRPVHHRHYPHLSNHFLRHYDRHGYGGHHGRGHGYYRGGRHGGGYARHFGPGRHAVGHFVRDAEREMPAGFLRAGKDRPLRLAEYGRLKNELRRADRKSGQKRGHGKWRKHRRDDLDRVVAKRPGDFPGLSKLAADEKANRHTKPSKAKGGTGKRGGKKFVATGEGPQRITKPKHPKPSRTHGAGKNVAKKGTPPERVSKPKTRSEKRVENKQRRTDEKQAKQERRTSQKQAKTAKRTSQKQAKTAKRTSQKQAKTAKRTSQKQAKTAKRTSQKQAKTVRQTEKKHTRAERRTSQKQAKVKKRTSQKEAKQRRQAEKKQSKKNR